MSLLSVIASNSTVIYAVCIPGLKYQAIVWLLKYCGWVLAPLQARHRRD